MADLTLKQVRRWFRESIDLEYYNRLYAMQVYMSGDASVLRSFMREQFETTGWGTRDDGTELPWYAEILPQWGESGLQNHGLVNARINVQGLGAHPRFQFQHPDPIVRQVNAAFMQQAWVEQGWSAQFYLGGMEVECNGFTGFEVGIDNGRVNIQHMPNLDVIFDRAHKAPGDWQWYCRRRRLTPEEAQERYRLSRADLESVTENVAPMDVRRAGTDNEFALSPVEVVIEWCFYTADFHAIFLKRLDGPNSVVYTLNPDTLGYRKAANADGTRLGVNPFGILPAVWWTDGWSPSVRRPVAKFETTMRLTSMLNEVEKYMVETLRNGVPIKAVDVSRITNKDLLKRLQEARSWSELSKILPIDGDIKDFLSSTPPDEIPSTCLALRAYLKEEINASTGVADMQRGQALTGERTRFEVQSLNDQSGIQARHFKRQFASALEELTGVVRPIGAQFDSAHHVLQLDDYPPVDTDVVPLAPFLAEPMPVEVSEASLMYMSEEERQQAAMVEMNQLHMPYIQMGVIDPMKSFDHIFRKYGGYKNPLLELGFDPQQAAMRQMGAMPGGPGSAPESGPNPSIS